VVLICCHPNKGATADNLLPRGAAFLFEMDGNLSLVLRDGVVSTLHW
jgi:hypothetical protein